MRIVFVCYGNPFTESMLYKENYFIKACVESGYEVLVLADNCRYENGKMMQTDEGESLIDGYRIKRSQPDRVLNGFLSSKIRKNRSFYDDIVCFGPDIIFFNTIQSYNLNYLDKIMEKLPYVKIFGDVSTSYYNSATNWISKSILHGVLYRHWIKKAEKYFTKIFYVTDDAHLFITQMYHLSEDKLEFNPLPCEVISADDRDERGRSVRAKYGIDAETIVMCHSGKFNSKKKTLTILDSFWKADRKDCVLILAGSFEEELKPDVLARIESDKRIIYTGFLPGDELTMLLSAVDLYIQIGSVSQTAQTAIGCGCPVVLTHDYDRFVSGNGYVIDSDTDLVRIISDFSLSDARRMSDASREIASRLIDYRTLVKAILP